MVRRRMQDGFSHLFGFHLRRGQCGFFVGVVARMLRVGCVDRSGLNERDRHGAVSVKEIVASKQLLKELRALEIERSDFHGDWNYVIHPRKQMG